MKFTKILEDIKLEKNVSIFMCVFLILVYFIYRKMYSCKKSIENMTILDDNQIKRAINKYYLSNEYLIDLTSLSKRIQDKGILIDGNIDVIGNIKADNEIFTQNFALTELNKKIDDKIKNFCSENTIYQRIGAGDNFRNFEFNIGFPSLNNMVQNARYFIFAAHKCNFFIWGFYLQNVDTEIRLAFWNRNFKIDGVQNNLLVIFEMNTKPSTNYNIQFIGQIPRPGDKRTRGELFPRIIFNNIELNPLTFRFASLFTQDIPDKDVTFFEGWRNPKLPFSNNFNWDWRSAFDLYKSSTKLPSIKWL